MSSVIDSIVFGRATYPSQVLSLMSEYVDDKVYKVGTERGIIKRTGVISNTLEKEIKNWRHVYNEFRLHDFNPTFVLCNTNNPEVAEIAIQLESCDVKLCLDIAVKESNLVAVRTIMTSGQVYPSVRNLTASIRNKDPECLSLLLSDSRIDDEAVIFCVLYCVDNNQTDCLKVVLENSEIPNDSISKCVKYSMENGSYRATIMLIHYMKSVDIALLNYTFENSLTEYSSLLIDVFSSLNENEM